MYIYIYIYDDATEVVGDLDESEMIDGIKKVADLSSEEHMKKMGRTCGENDVIYIYIYGTDGT